MFSKKSTNAINVISGITMVAMAVGAFAMIALMSVFNGFEELVVERFNVFYSDVKVTPSQGKYFDISEAQIVDLKAIEGVELLSTILEEDALLENYEEQYIATVKGVDPGYLDIIGLNEDYILNGKLALEENGEPVAIIGVGVRINLGINVNFPTKIKVNIPRKNARLTSLENALNFKYIVPTSEFNIQQEFDEKYVLVPQAFLRSIRGKGNDYSSIEIKLKEGANEKATFAAIEQILPNVDIKNRWEQNATLYSVMRAEKWVVFAVLTFVMLIISFSIAGALSMLIVDKQKDIAVLRSIGATTSTIRNIFLTEGVLLSLVGVSAGVLMAFLFCTLQQTVGIIPMPGQSFVVDFYPVKMKAFDFIATILAIFAISFLAAYFPTLRAIQEENISESIRTE